MTSSLRWIFYYRTKNCGINNSTIVYFSKSWLHSKWVYDWKYECKKRVQIKLNPLQTKAMFKRVLSFIVCSKYDVDYPDVNLKWLPFYWIVVNNRSTVEWNCFVCTGKSECRLNCDVFVNTNGYGHGHGYEHGHMGSDMWKLIVERI